MGPWGAIIMSFFAGVFFTAATVLATGWKSPLLLIPFLVFAVIATLAARRIKQGLPGAFEPDARAGKIISWASIAEGVGIPAMAMLLANTGHNDIVLPDVALIVGLHFVPMAYAIPFRPFYLLTALLILAAVAGTLLKQPTGSIMAGLAASLALRLASALALTRKPGSPA
jgi:hypothetical protein